LIFRENTSSEKIILTFHHREICVEKNRVLEETRFLSLKIYESVFIFQKEQLHHEIQGAAREKPMRPIIGMTGTTATTFDQGITRCLSTQEVGYRTMFMR
jgi:hypothetical protein